MTLTAAPAERTTSSDEVNLMGHGDVSLQDKLPKTVIENPQDFGVVLGKTENFCLLRLFFEMRTLSTRRVDYP